MGECDFIEKEINYDKTLKIIDIGCGTGRHTIELTKRGYSVTGIDLSESMLNKEGKSKNKTVYQLISGNTMYEIFRSTKNSMWQ